MNVSHVSSFYTCIRTVALVIGVTVFSMQLSFSQNGPVRLAPPQKSGSETSKDSVDPGAVEPTQTQQKPVKNTLENLNATIEVDSLKTINPDTAGVLNEKEGGFGVELWKGTSRELLETMIERLPVNLRSEVMRGLVRRLLLSTALLPEGMAGDGSYVATRVGLLSAMGDSKSVSQLLEATPGRAQIDRLVRYEADARFLANDNARACSLAAGQIINESSIYWQKAFIFCQALAGEHDKAALGVSLLQDSGYDDNAFYTLVETLAGNPENILSLPDPSPIHLSMARITNTQLPNDVVSSNHPGVLRTIAISPNASVEIRLEASERAEITGALDVDTLRQLYTSVSFSEEDLANPLSKAEAESGPLSRALLYRTSLIQTVPIAQAEAASKALSLGRQGGRYSSIVRVFMPVLKRIPPTTELVWFAPEIIRAFLVGGEHSSITPWLSLLELSAKHDAGSAEALTILLPLIKIAYSPQNFNWSPAYLESWWQEISKNDDATDKASLLFTLFKALGHEVPKGIWYSLLRGPERVTMAMPNPALWHSLSEATEAAMIVESDPNQTDELVVDEKKEQETYEIHSSALEPKILQRKGEIILLSLIALGEGGPGQAEPIVLKKVIHSMKIAGLNEEIRAIALEAAIAAGL